MPNFIDTQTGEPTSVYGSDAEQKFLAGKINPTGNLLLYSPDGTTIGATPEQAKEFLRAGYRFPSALEQNDRAIEQQTQGEYGSGFWNKAQAFGEGALRGATLGLSDVALSSLDAEGSKGLRERRNRAGTGVVGEVAGGLATVAVGGEGLLARALAKTPTGLATRVAARAATRVPTKTAAMAVEGAIETGLFGAGQSISQATLSDDPFTVESLAVNMGSGAALGLVAGGGLGAISSIAQRAKRGLAGKANPLLNPAEKSVKEMSERFNGELQRVDGALNHSWDEGGPLGGAHGVWGDMRARELAKRAPKPGQAVDNAATMVDGAMPEAMGVERAIQQDAKLAQRARTELDVAQPTVVDNGAPTEISVVERELDPNATGLGKRRGKAKVRGMDLGGEPTVVDHTQPTHPTMLDAGGANRVERQRTAGARTEIDISTSRGAKSPRMEFDGGLGAADDEIVGGINALRKEFHQARGALARSFGGGVGFDLNVMSKMSPKQALKAAAAFDNYLGVVGKIDQTAGSELSHGLAKGGDLIERLKVGAPEPMKLALDKLNALDAVAMADALGAPVEALPVAGSAAHTLLQLYLVARLGSVAGAMPSAIARIRSVGSTVGKVGMRRLGAQRAAGAVMERALQGPGQVLMRLATGSGKVRQAIDTGLDGFIRAAQKSGTRRAVSYSAATALERVRYGEQKATERNAVKARMKELAELAANPGRLEATLAETLGPVTAHNAGLGTKLGEHYKARYQYLHETMPKGMPIGMFGDTIDPSEIESLAWARRAAAAEDPVGWMLNEMHSGDLSIETVETIQHLYPTLHQEIRTTLFDKLADFRTELNYQDRLQLSLLYDVPVEPSMDPEVYQVLQEMHEAAAAQQQQASAPRGTPKPHTPTKAQLLGDR